MTGYQFRGFTIEQHMLDRLNAYIDHGEAVGHFLTAVLENNLKEAVGRADDENMRNLPAYVGYLYNVADSRCHGSPAKVREWYMAKALEHMQDLKVQQAPDGKRWEVVNTETNELHGTFHQKEDAIARARLIGEPA
jgi:hypothetical protein